VDWFGARLTPMEGGYSGETFLVGDDPAEQLVLRIYERNRERAVVDAALLELVRGIIPVPTVVDLRLPEGDHPGILVTSRLRGTALSLVLPTASTRLRATLGRNLGHVLARLSGVPMLRTGMFEGPALHIGEGLPAGGLREWAGAYRDGGRLAAWSDSDYRSLQLLLDTAESLFDGDGGGSSRLHPTDTTLSRRVLVHSDFNPKNILVDPETGDVTGVLDWEFAHAGSPYADLGNLTRFERHDDFVDAVLETFVAHAPELAENPLDLARSADLWALVELAGGMPTNAVRELAAELLLAQARAGDLHAWPWETPRVDPQAARPVP
jgi:aminoglycoside phosphotransferase (APT) family kinase protein